MPTEPSDQQIPRSEEVFISYSRKDKEFVRRLDEKLKPRNRRAWVDWEGIPPGDKWEKTIYGAIESTVMIDALSRWFKKHHDVRQAACDNTATGRESLFNSEPVHIFNNFQIGGR